MRFKRNEVFAALAMMGFGLLWLWIGLGYSWGNSVRIGAGVFPVALSIILIGLCLGLVIMARGVERRPLGIRFRPVALILGGILFWALTVDVLGFVPASAIMLAMCAFAERESTWFSTVALVIFLCVFGYAVFIVALKIPLSVLGG